MVLRLIKEEIERFRERKEIYVENIKKIARKYNLKCYLFGSRARGESTPSSDMDILVILPEKLWGLRWKIYDEMRKACEDNAFVEIHVIHEEVFKETKRLYGKLVQINQ